MISMKLKSSIAISESGFVFNAERGDSFSVNPLGTIVLQRIQQGDDLEAVTQFVATHYDVDVPTAEKDMHDFMQQLQQLNLVTKDEVA